MRCVPLFLLSTLLLAQDNLNFLANHTDGPEIRGQFSAWRKRLAREALEARRKTVDRIRTPEDLAARRKYIRDHIVASLGGLPDRTPLNPQVVGTIEGDGYRVEKVVFESQPRFFVTANLYVPKGGRGPYPAVLFPLGHEEGSKSHHAWQHVLISLAKKGYVALAWDPVGQGERVQLYDEDFGGSKVVRSTTEHTILGLQCLLTGDAIARYTIWDGIRALDYLLSRPEVDPKRIGVTGNSGGGTHTSYLAALDDRFQVAAPSCYLTSWRQLLDTIGPQDGRAVFARLSGRRP
jgi:dipeptidyl aminopeptidase/acylaminoacyl peptidase